MNTKAVVYLLITIFILASLFMGIKTLKAQEEKTGQTSDVSTQLQQIIQNQQTILSKLEEMKEELRIIKVRTAIRAR